MKNIPLPQAAKRIGISERALRRMITTKKIEAIVKGTNLRTVYFINEETVKKLEVSK
jgi:predicted DNA-binding protein (UPF0251 family)